MKKQIKLFNNYGIWEEGKDVLKESENLVVVFDYEIPEKTSLFVTISNGMDTIQGSVKNSEIIINNSFLKAGNLKFKVDLLLKGQVIKEYKVEDLIVKEIDGEIKVIPQIEEMKQCIEDTKKMLEENLSDINKKVELLESKLDFFIKLWREEL